MQEQTKFVNISTRAITTYYGFVCFGFFFGLIFMTQRWGTTLGTLIGCTIGTIIGYRVGLFRERRERDNDARKDDD